MKRSLKKYDNGGKTKKPVFPGKLDNRVVSDNTSVQRPTIQQQDVRLKTPQEVKKANRKNFQKRIGVKPTYNVQELTDFGTPEPGLEDASLEALDALSLASGVGYLGKKGLQVGAKGLANVLKSKPKFNSEIDWAKWNKEIPSNQPLLQEYNAIEQSTKKAGTWMKNLDGSAFQGTPEQFIQQQSNNFKKAYPEGVTIGYRGAHQHINNFANKDRSDYATFLTDSKVNAETYAGSDGLAKTYYNPNVNTSDEWVDGLYELGIPNNLPKVIGEAEGRNWRLLNYNNKIAEGAKNKEFAKRFQKELKDNKELYNYNDYDPNKKYLSTDIYANYIKNTNNPEGIAQINNVIDQMGTANNIPANTVYAIDANRVPLKSLRYNNGMFDMTNPNIYKSIAPYAIPTAIGAGALQQNQEQPQYPTGGTVNTLEGDLISKVIMNRNRDKNFVNRAYAVGQNPNMFTLQDPENFGNVMSHKMAYGEDDAGQAYMYPTIMNPNNEAIKVPNQYADYISSDGYKKETNMEYGKGGYTVKRSSDRKGKTHVVIGPDGTKKYFGDPNLGERGKSKYGKEAFYARHKKNLDANPYFRAYARATWEDGGTIPEQGHISMNKRSLFKYGGLTVTDLNKYELGGSNLGNASKIKPVSGATAKIPSGSGSPTPSPTGATVSGSAIGAGIGFGAEMVGALIPEKQYTDDEGADLGSVKSIGESTLEYGAKGAAVTAMLGGADFGIATALGAGYGAYKGWADKEEMQEKQKEANFKNSQRKLSSRMNNSVNFGNADVNTSTNMMFAAGGMLLNQDDPNANAELELQETFQMPDGTVGNVDGPSHENGGIAVDLPEGTRIWSDKLKHNGKTFAKHTKPITNTIAKLEKQIEKNPVNSDAKENSIALLKNQLDYYFDTQETNKQNTEMKRTLREGGMIKRADGSYSKRGLWDNIRANKGSGKKPTPEMLKQERKINNEMAMGGYMYGQGGTNNPGFNALPEEVQENILAHMSMGGRLMNDPMFAEGGIHIKPENKGKFTAYAESHGKGVQEMAAHIMANKEDYSPAVVKRANFAKNAAGWKHRMGGYLPMHQDGDMVGNPNRVALGAMNPRTNKPYSETEVARYYNSKDMLDRLNSAAAELGDFRENNYGGINNKNQISQGSFNNGIVPNQAPSRVFSPKVDYAQKTLTPTSLKDRVNFIPPAMDSDFDMNQIPQELMYNNSFNVAKSANKPFGQLPSNTKFNLQAPGNNMEQSFLRQDNTPQEVIPYFEDPGFDINAIDPALMYNTPESSYATKPFNQLPIGITRPNTKLNIGEFGANANRYIAPENLTMGDIGAPTPGQSTAPGFFNKAGQFIQNNPGLIGQLGTAALTAGTQMNRINRLARPRTLADVRLRDSVANPNLVDYSAERNAIDRAALTGMGEAQRGFGSSAAAQAFKNKARLNQLEGTGRSFQGQENANAQIKNQFLAARQEAAMKEAMMNNDISKYNLENVYGYDTMTTAQKNAITAMLGNTAGQTFGKQTDYANQLEKANILSNQYDPSVLNDMIKNGKLKVVDGKIVKARNGGTIKKRSFKK